jgi:serine O-acetyltransferase
MYNEIRAIKERDPAARGTFEILLSYSGLHALMFHRLAHWLWRKRIPVIPRLISQISRFITGIEIHPGAEIGRGLFIDHGMGVVIGETSIVGDNVTLFQGVTLGGTGKERGKRHPTINDNVTVGAGAKILGNITIGSYCYIGANAVVLKDVPAYCTVVGVPGIVVRREGKRVPRTLSFDHIHLPHPILERINRVQEEIDEIISHCRSFREKHGVHCYEIIDKWEKEKASDKPAEKPKPEE